METRSSPENVILDNITGYLSRNASLFPDKPAMIHPKFITFSELDADVDRYAAGLSAIGISKGMHTIVLVSAGAEFFILCFALFRIGAVPIMIDPGMGTKSMARSLAGSGAQAFIGVPKAHLLKFLYPACFTQVRIWIHTGRGWIPGAVPLSSLRMEIERPPPQCKMEAKETGAIFFTSGSTGPPKGVVYQAGMLEAMVGMLEGHYKYGPEDIDLCTFPLLGLFVTCLGSSLLIADMDPLKPARLDPEKLISNLNDFNCTQMFGSPMILNRLVRYSKSNPVSFHSLKRVISAGAPVPLETQKEFLELCDQETEIHTPYGSTEALPVTDITASELLSQSEVADYEDGICVGYPLPGVELRIIKINDDPVLSWIGGIESPPGEVGEIVAMGPHVTREYKNNDHANQLAKIPGSSSGKVWHRMGDLGRIDEGGRLWFYGRKKHRVATKERLLFSIPTEAVFNRHPQVKHSALVGVNKKGQKHAEPVICIQVEQGIRRSQYSQLRRELFRIAEGNSLTKHIHHILFHQNFPVDPRHNAKIVREELADWAERRIR